MSLFIPPSVEKSRVHSQVKYEGQEMSGVEMSFLKASFCRPGPKVLLLKYSDGGPSTPEIKKRIMNGWTKWLKSFSLPQMSPETLAS